MFFTKYEYKEIMLPIVYDNNSDDLYAGLISVEAYGNISGENQYCFASYSADLKFINELATLLKNRCGKSVKVILKIKKGKIKDFTIDLDSLAKAYNDERFKQLELVGWGLNDKSFKEID